jgi:RecJ-like exonuclease
MSSPADNYWPEACAYCGGDGKLPTVSGQLLAFHGLAVEQFYGTSREALPGCDVCGGKAFVLVLQPARHCQRCAGTGRLLQTRCPYCKGAGWMFVLNETRII